MRRIATGLALIVSAAIAGCVSSDPDVAPPLADVLPPRADRPHDVNTNTTSVAEQKKSMPSTPANPPVPSGARQQVNETYPETYPGTRTEAPTVAGAPQPSMNDQTDRIVNLNPTEKRETDLTSPPRVHLISPESPLAEFGPIGELWGLYRVFEFQRVIECAVRFSPSTETTGYEVASIYALAAASAYLRGDQNLALTFVRDAVQADFMALPDPDYFPGAFCRFYEAVLRSERYR